MDYLWILTEQLQIKKQKRFEIKTEEGVFITKWLRPRDILRCNYSFVIPAYLIVLQSLFTCTSYFLFTSILRQILMFNKEWRSMILGYETKIIKDVIILEW